MADDSQLDVDWTLVDWFLSLTPAQRLAYVEAQADLLLRANPDLRREYGYEPVPSDEE